MAEALFVSPKTVDHHIQHIYDKIGVSTRARRCSRFSTASWRTEARLQTHTPSRRNRHEMG